MKLNEKQFIKMRYNQMQKGSILIKIRNENFSIWETNKYRKVIENHNKLIYFKNKCEKHK